MVSTWTRLGLDVGLDLASTWSRLGLNLDSTWSRLGLDWVSIWSQFGLDLVSTWSRFGLNLVSIWSWFGLDIGLDFGLDLVSTWSRLGLDRDWLNFLVLRPPNLVFVFVCHIHQSSNDYGDKNESERFLFSLCLSVCLSVYLSVSLYPCTPVSLYPSIPLSLCLSIFCVPQKENWIRKIFFCLSHPPIIQFGSVGMPSRLTNKKWNWN